ncbi:MAG: dihydropteroate synthase [Dehalococcoidia bacterium]|nr:dihydropteroate synthase [Dehalococcoidia bacterium]
MILIGENIHIISSDVSVAVKERNAKVIRDLAIAQTKAGVHYIDLNMGPARKNPEETAEWLVKTVQEVSDLPLSIDTLNPVAMEAGLRACTKGRPLLNSASGRTDSKEQTLPLAKKYNTDLVLSVLTDKGCPPDVETRMESIMETVAYANELGIPNEDLWIDPILLPVSADQQQVIEALEFMKIVGDVLPGVKSTIGLSNLSNGTPEELRPILNRTYMVMLGRYGQHSVIADALDKELIRLNKGDMPEIVDLIYRVMDGEDVDLSSLSQQARDYAKTVKVLLGETLYSHSWLED